jgi:octaprenyl-diphosphate synthase
MENGHQLSNIFLDIPLIKIKLDSFEKFLDDELKKYSDSIFYESIVYALKGGKRIRPIILMLSADVVGIPEKEPFSAALAIELVHTVSLVHDDIIDKEKYRRGKPAYHEVYGLDQSILLADFALSVVVDLINKYKSSVLFSIISDAVKKMSEGELFEVKIRNRKKITIDDYLKIVENKTSSLFEASSRIGALLATKNSEDIENLSNFGKYLGIAYQIYDDIRDWQSKEYVQKLDVKNPLEFLKERADYYLNESSKYLKKLPSTTAREALQYFIDVILKST